MVIVDRLSERSAVTHDIEGTITTCPLTTLSLRLFAVEGVHILGPYIFEHEWGVVRT